LAIISALCLESLLAILCAQILELDLVGLEAVRRMKAGGSEGTKEGGSRATPR